MKYITGLQALNLTCSLDTTGDWHQPCLDWSHLSLWDTDTAFYKDYGIEENSHVPEHPGEKFKVANHIRALLDMLYAKDFGNARGMNRDYIGRPLYDGEIFAKVMEMRRLPYWDEIDRFMEKEYLMKWVRFRGQKKGALMSDWKKQHAVAISDFLRFLNKETSSFILKGETALAQCYGLTRFSEDIDFDSDSAHQSIIPFVAGFCALHDFSYRITKNTDAVKRFFIHYGNSSHPLKVEVSYRDQSTLLLLPVFTVSGYIRWINSGQ